MIAVTGANGLLGSYVIRELIANNISFIALKRVNSDTSLLKEFDAKITWLDADVVDPVAMEEAFKNVTHVIHVAAMVSFNPRQEDEILTVNVQGTRNVVNACLTNGVKKLVHISSVAALGRLKGQASINEDQKWIDNPLNSTYAESKYLAELEVFRGQEEGLETVILNPSVILGAADWTRSSAKLFKYVWDEKPFYMESYLNYVDVRDVARAAIMLLNVKAPGERFILNAGSIPLSTFFSMVATRMKRKAPSVKLNKSLVQLVAFVEGARSRIMRSEPLITRETARLAGTEFIYQNEKIKKQLNFKFQAVEQTLDWCCEYYINKIAFKK